MNFSTHLFPISRRGSRSAQWMAVFVVGVNLILAAGAPPTSADEVATAESQLATTEEDAAPQTEPVVPETSPTSSSSEASSDSSLPAQPLAEEVDEVEDEPPPPPELSRWIRELRSPFLWQRHQAMRRLVEAGRPAVKPLVDCLADADWRIRELAVTALGQIGDRRAVQPVVNLLTDPAWQVRRSAAQALGIMRDPGTVDPLMRTLSGDPDWTVRQAAAEAIGQIGDARAIPALTAALRDRQQEVRLAALTALGHIDDPRVLDPLLACFDSGDWQLQKQAAASLAERGEQAVGPLMERFRAGDPARQKLVCWTLVQIGVPAVPAMLAYLEEVDCDRQKAAVELIIQIGPSAADQVSQRLTHPKASIRRLAVEMLESLGWLPASDRQKAEFYLAKQEWDALVTLGPVAIETLSLRKDDEDPFVRAKVAECLGRIGHPNAVDVLATMLQDSDRQVRWHVVSALTKISDPRVLEQLTRCLADEDPEVRAVAIRGLGRLGDPEAVPALVAALKDPEKEVVRAAVESLTSYSDVRAAEPLLALVDSPEVGMMAIRALGRIKDPGVVSALLARLPQATPVRQAAILEALGELGYPEAADEVYMIFENREFPEFIRQAAARCLGKLGDRRVLEYLVQSALNADSPFREQAADALGALAEEATPRLLAHLRSPNAKLRRNAAAALLRLGYKPERIDQHVDLLLAAEDWEKIRGMGSAAMSPLSARLRDPNPKIRKQIAELLRQMGYRPTTPRAIVDLALAEGNTARLSELRDLGSSAIEPLVSWLQASDAASRAWAAELLTDLGYSPQTEAEQAWWALAKGDWATLEKLGPIAADPVALLLEERNDELVAKAVDLLVKLADPRAAPFVARRLPNWKQRRELYELLQQLRWEPQSDPEQVYWRVAAGDWGWLDGHWDTTKKVLLDDLHSKEFRRIEHAAYVLINIGREEIIPDLIQALEEHGTAEMAETFHNSGQARLKEAAERWATQRGGCFLPGPGAREAVWPSSGGTQTEPGPVVPGGSEPEKTQASPPAVPESSGEQAPSSESGAGSAPSQQGTPSAGQDTQTGITPLSMEQALRESRMGRLELRELTRRPLDDPTKQQPVVDRPSLRPINDPTRDRPLTDPAQRKPLTEPWRQLPDPARVPSMTPPVQLPPDPSRLAPPPRVSVPSFGPSFGGRF